MTSAGVVGKVLDRREIPHAIQTPVRTKLYHVTREKSIGFVLILGIITIVGIN